MGHPGWQQRHGKCLAARVPGVLLGASRFLLSRHEEPRRLGAFCNHGSHLCVSTGKTIPPACSLRFSRMPQVRVDTCRRVSAVTAARRPARQSIPDSTRPRRLRKPHSLGARRHGCCVSQVGCAASGCVCGEVSMSAAAACDVVVVLKLIEGEMKVKCDARALSEVDLGISLKLTIARGRLPNHLPFTSCRLYPPSHQPSLDQ